MLRRLVLGILTGAFLIASNILTARSQEAPASAGLTPEQKKEESQKIRTAAEQANKEARDAVAKAPADANKPAPPPAPPPAASQQPPAVDQPLSPEEEKEVSEFVKRLTDNVNVGLGELKKWVWEKYKSDHNGAEPPPIGPYLAVIGLPDKICSGHADPNFGWDWRLIRECDSASLHDLAIQNNAREAKIQGAHDVIHKTWPFGITGLAESAYGRWLNAREAAVPTNSAAKLVQSIANAASTEIARADRIISSLLKSIEPLVQSNMQPAALPTAAQEALESNKPLLEEAKSILKAAQEALASGQLEGADHNLGEAARKLSNVAEDLSGPAATQIKTTLNQAARGLANASGHIRTIPSAQAALAEAQAAAESSQAAARAARSAAGVRAGASPSTPQAAASSGSGASSAAAGAGETASTAAGAGSAASETAGVVAKTAAGAEELAAGAQEASAFARWMSAVRGGAQTGIKGLAAGTKGLAFGTGGIARGLRAGLGGLIMLWVLDKTGDPLADFMSRTWVGVPKFADTLPFDDLIVTKDTHSIDPVLVQDAFAWMLDRESNTGIECYSENHPDCFLPYTVDHQVVLSIIKRRKEIEANGLSVAWPTVQESKERLVQGAYELLLDHIGESPKTEMAPTP